MASITDIRGISLDVSTSLLGFPGRDGEGVAFESCLLRDVKSEDGLQKKIGLDRGVVDRLFYTYRQTSKLNFLRNLFFPLLPKDLLPSEDLLGKILKIWICFVVNIGTLLFRLWNFHTYKEFCPFYQFLKKKVYLKISLVKKSYMFEYTSKLKRSQKKERAKTPGCGELRWT